MTAALLSDLARAKALFQQRAIATHITGRIQPSPTFSSGAALLPGAGAAGSAESHLHCRPIPAQTGEDFINDFTELPSLLHSGEQ